MVAIDDAGSADSGERGPDGPVTEPGVDAPVAGGIELLYRSHRASMVRLAVFLLGDMAAAEDVVQDAYTHLHRQWPTLRSADAAAAYLRTSVVNASRSHQRRQRTARLFAHTQHQPDVAAADYRALIGDEHRQVMDALRALPARQREAIVLRYWGDLDEAGIAEAMGVGRGTVKSTTSRGLAALEKTLREQR